ncbi:MgtC/SapB family protein [Sporosarcina siberiensis]|uniref:MgtC/SapB family protein n=1 Tax=Sporosarcina siberiensis TaxID=1365606 RepID=A0ABW4SIE0_9BACL
MAGIGIVILKLVLAAVAGLVLGLEREAKHKPLGLKTCVVISIASCLLTIVSIEFALTSYKGTLFTGADPMRLASQIVSGVGFLGAGVILRRDNNVISGLTTAAIVWAASGFGIAIGAGYYIEVALGIGLISLTVSFLPFIMRKIGPTSLKEQEAYLTVYVDPAATIDAVVKEIETFVISIENVKVKGDGDGHRLDMSCFISDGKGNIFTQYDKIRKIPGINQVEITKI